MKFILMVILALTVPVVTFAQEDSTELIPTDEYYKAKKSDDIYALIDLLRMGYSYSQITSATEKGSLIKIQGKEELIKTNGWLYCTESTSKDKWFIRTELINKSYGEIKVWIKIKSPTLTIKKKVYKDAYQKVLIYFKCKEKETKTMKFVSYNKDGELIDQIDTPYDNYETIIPDSVVEEALKIVCYLFN